MPKGSGRKSNRMDLSADMYDEVDDYIEGTTSKGGLSKKHSKKAPNGVEKTTSVMDLDMSEEESEEDLGSYDSGSEEGGVEEGSESEEGKVEFDDKNWGRRKATYHQRDEESDFDESDEEALAEEAEARRLQKQRAASRREEDFDDSFASRATKSSAHAAGAKKLTSTDAGLLETMYKEMGQFESSLTASDPTSTRDLSGLSRQEKLDLITKDSPELLLLLDSFNAKMKEIREKLAPLIQRARDLQIPTSKGLSYLETKYHLLLNYCTNICFYLLLKAEGKTVKNHPVIEHLARTRTVIDRLKPLDQKLKYQIDKLLKLAAQGEANLQSDPKLRHRANIKGFLPIGKEAADDEDDEDDSDDDMNGMDSDENVETGRSALGASLDRYVAPKFAPTGDREEKRKLRAEKKAKSSSMAQYLIDEFGDRPLEHTLSTGPRDKSLREAQAERDRYEEDNFVRLGLTKKEKKASRQASVFVDEYADLADFGDLKALDRADALQMAEDMESKAFKSSSSKKRKTASEYGNDDDEEIAVGSSKSSKQKDRVSAILDSIDKRAEASAAAKAHRYGVDEEIDYESIKDEKRAKRMKLKEDREKAEAKHLIDMEKRAQDAAAAQEASSGRSKKEKRTTYSETADAMDEDDDFYKEAVALQKAAKADKLASSRAARSDRKRERDDAASLAADEAAFALESADGHRKVSKQIEENKGLRKTKKKELKNSRVKFKGRYEDALKKLKSRGGSKEASKEQRFAGTSTGINRRVVHSTQL